MTTEFSPDYARARERFIERCTSAGIDVVSHRNPGTGPEGEPLYTDCAIVGPENPDRVMIVNSGNHGVEGFCGSAALAGWLRSGFHRRLPVNTRVILIHALNPYGFAWLRRVNEDNVDLNRNFLESHVLPPENPDYERLHQHFLPQSWDAGSTSHITRQLAREGQQRGLLTMQARVCRGQYSHDDGVFYGGCSPTWSNRVFLDTVDEHASTARRVVFLDFHTGLGAFGEPELICAAPPDAHLSNWFTDRLTSARLGNAVGPGLSGTIGQGLRRAVPAAKVYSVTVEFGTYDIYRVLMSIVADNWLHVRGEGDSVATEIKAEIRACFYPDSDAWRLKVQSASQRILDQALDGIAAE